MRPQLDQKSTGPVTVVIPCYNAEHLIARALGSVARQTLVPAEVLVVDDGSITPVETAVKDFSKGFPDLSLRVIRKDNGGPSSARNLGLAHAAQEFVAFLDADDEMEPAHLAAKVAKLSSLSANYFGVYGTMSDAGRQSPDGDHFDGLMDVARIGRRGGLPGSSSAYLFRKEALRSVAGFDECLVNNEDFDLLIRLTRKGYLCSGPHGPAVIQHRQPVSVSRPRDPYVAFRHSEKFLAKAEVNEYFSDEELGKRRRGARRSLAKRLLRQGRIAEAAWELNEAYRNASPRVFAERMQHLCARLVLLFVTK